MSSSFRLRYFFGLIPTAQKIDSAWSELFKMRDELQQIENSKELSRYKELTELTKSNDFQTKKQDIIHLNFQGSAENKQLTAWKSLEHSKPIRDYFKFLQSPDFKKLKNITESSELTRYFELKEIVESPDFLRRKKEIDALSYKGSPEYVKRSEFTALQKNSRLKRYFSDIASDEYRLFIELEATEKVKLNDRTKRNDPKFKIYKKYLNSSAYKNIKTVEKLGLLPKFEKLKAETDAKPFIERETFLKNVNRFETTPDFIPFDEYSKLSKNPDIVFYLKCISSALHINYQKVAESKELTRLNELRLMVEDPEFKQRVDFLKNKKRYETTSGFAQERELAELKKSKPIITYHQLKKRPELAFFDQWEIALEEDFSDHKLASTIWEPENYWGSKMAGCSFSQPNELQAYQGIKNIEIKNKVLSIVTKAEKAQGKVWDPTIGLIPRIFDYSSAILNTGNSFKFKEGVVEAKVKFRAEKSITSAFSLTGSKPFPQIDVFRSGYNSVGLGIIDQPGQGGINNLVQIKGLDFSKFHIFRVEIFGSQVVWKINNHEVHRQQVNRNLGELFINFVGSLHQPLNGTSLPHHFEIDWVRCLQKK